MPRYIDADAFFADFAEIRDYEYASQEYEVDAVEVVRCKDCKHGSPNGEYGCKAYHFKLYETHEMKADDFCSHGERREDAEVH